MLFQERKRRRRFEQEAAVHLNALYGLALRLSKNERDAEDLVQDTCLKAYQHWEKYTEGTNCKAWLFKILTNTFINRYRKKQRQRTVFAEDMTVSPLERLCAAAENPIERGFADHAEVMSELFGDEVCSALEEVPVDFRIVVLLVDVFDWSYKEAAEIVGCPIGTIMSRLYRGRRILQSRLLDYAVREGIVGPRQSDEENNVVPFPSRGAN